jgi:hypothetical protein
VFKSKTLFVVGAGASQEVKLPIGSELKQQIANKVNIRWDRFRSRRLAGDEFIDEALRTFVRKPDGSWDITRYVQAGWAMASAMPQAISIDNYMHSHSGNEGVEVIGKMGIAKAILDAEKNSLLKLNKETGEINLNGVSNTWYASFLKKLTEGVHRKDIDQIFENVSIITFNYDRCIEHYLLYGLKSYYSLTLDEAQAAVRKLKIYHPYGKVGDLPWIVNNTNSLDFAELQATNQLIYAFKGIKTFTEQIEEGDELKAIRQEIADSETLIFLGFAFHEMNMQLLTPSVKPITKRVFATTKGISNGDLEVVNQQIRKLLQRRLTGPEMGTGFRFYHGNSLTCTELFDEFWRSISN